MRLAVVCLTATALACSQNHKPGDQLRRSPGAPITAEGAIQVLGFVNTDLLFCDTRGAHRVDPKSGKSTPDSRPCSAVEPNTACSGIDPELSVRASTSEPRDIVDLGASSYPLPGRVRDCAAAGDYLAIATGSGVLLIDKRLTTTKEISAQGADRVAVNKEWIAWSEGVNIRVALIATSGGSR